MPSRPSLQDYVRERQQASKEGGEKVSEARRRIIDRSGCVNTGRVGIQFVNSSP